MEPIISPWYFYFAQVATRVIVVSMAISIISIIAAISFFAASYDGDDEQERGMKMGKHFFTIGVIFMLISILTPDDNTVYKMLAASLVTPDNITIAENGTIDFIERLAEAIAKHIK